MRRLPEPSADAAVRPERSSGRTLRTVALAAAMTGLVCFAVHDALPAPWSDAGTSPALWCALAWLAGAQVTPPAGARAALAGSVAMASLLGGFLVGLFVLAGRGEDPGYLVRMAVLVIVAGSCSGLAGGLRWVRGRASALAAGVLGAAFAGEAVLRSGVELYVYALRPLTSEFEQHILPTAAETGTGLALLAVGLAAAAVAAPAGRRSQAVATTAGFTAVGLCLVLVRPLLAVLPLL